MENQLKPLVRRKYDVHVELCKGAGIAIKITSGFRSFEEQNKLYAQGRTTPGQIVTKAKGGESLHNYGVAYDVCPIVNGKFDWNAPGAIWEKIAKFGEDIGCEAGAHWKEFVDQPHFQILCGYKLSDFQNNKVDWNKFK